MIVQNKPWLYREVRPKCAYVRRPLRVWPKFSRPNSLHLAAVWLRFLWVFRTLWPSLQETSEERPNNVIPSPKMAEKAWECSSAVSSALVSPCLHLCNRVQAEWTEDDFLCDSGDGVTEPTLLSDDQLSQTLHCARPPSAHHSFHFLFFCLCWEGKKMHLPAAAVLLSTDLAMITQR